MASWVFSHHSTINFRIRCFKMSLLRSKKLSKNFDEFSAVKGINFDLDSAQVKGIMGPNGAGKSTLLQLLSGYLSPTSGKIFFQGEDITHASISKKSRIGISYLPQRPSLFPSLTVEENLRGSAQWNSMFSHDTTDASVRELLGLTQLEKRSGIPAQDLSYGEMKVLDLGISLASRPKVLLADEPTAGVDEGARKKIIDLLKFLTDGTNSGKFALDGLIFVEHSRGALFEVADVLCFINQGEITSAGPPELIRENQEVKEYLKEHG